MVYLMHTYIFHFFNFMYRHTFIPRLVISKFLHTRKPEGESSFESVTVNNFCCLNLRKIERIFHPHAINSVKILDHVSFRLTSIQNVLVLIKNISYFTHTTISNYCTKRNQLLKFLLRFSYTWTTWTMHEFSGSMYASGFSLNPDANIIEVGGFFLLNTFQCSASFLLNSANSFLE